MKTNTPRLDSARSRLGYVLMIVLATSVLVVTVLGTLANVSLRRALQAADAGRELQQRWGTLTLQKTVLSQAPDLFLQRQELATESRLDAPPPPMIRDAMTLGGVTFDLMLGDEDAKLNLNVIYHLSGRQKTEQVLSEASPSAAMYARLVPAVQPQQLSRQQRSRPRDSDSDEEIEPVADAFRSWGEVFDINALEQNLGSEAALPIATTGITCWGSGQLNFQRATDEAILAVAGSIVQDGGARRILKRYRDNPTIDLAALLQNEVANPQNRRQLARRLGQTSNHFSLWIHSSTPQRKFQQQLTVMSRDDEGVIRFESFAL